MPLFQVFRGARAAGRRRPTNAPGIIAQTSFELSPAGTAIPLTGVAGDGDAFTAGLNGTDGTFVTANDIPAAIAAGSFAAKMSVGTVANQNYREWDFNAVSNPVVRMYIYLTSYSSAANVLVSFRSGSTGISRVFLNATTGTISISNGANLTAIATTTAAVPLNTLIRIEGGWDLNAGTASVDLYTGHSTIPLTNGSLTVSGQVWSSTTTDNVRLGSSISGATNWSFYTDGWAIGNVNRIGPLGVSDPYGDLIRSATPAAWWRGNGSTADEIAGGSSGVLTNGATYGTGILPARPTAQVFSLDAVDDYVSIPDQNKIDFTNSFTVEAWVVFNDVTGSHTIVGKNNSWWFGLTGGLLDFFCNTSGGTGDCFIAHGMTNGTVYHVAATFDGANLRLYRNGTLVKTTARAGTLTVNTGAVYIGKDWDPNVNPLGGKTAEVAVYGRVLTDTEIANHYTTGNISADPYGDTIRTAAPIAWYRGNGSTADEISGGTAGTLVNGATYGTSIVPASPSAQSFSLDGVDDYVSVANQTKLSISSTISVECWVKPGRLPATGLNEFFVKQSAWGIEVNATSIRFFIYQGAAAKGTVAATVSVGTVYHVVGTFDGTVNRLYINGALAATSASIAGAIDTNTNPVQIGAWGAGFYAQGNVSEAAIYNRVLTSTEITNHYNTGNTAPSSVGGGGGGSTTVGPAHADSFIDSIGINTHIGYSDYYNNWDIGLNLHPKFTSLGVRHIRDAMYNQLTPSWQTASNSEHHVRMRALSSQGIKMLLGNRDGDYSVTGLQKALSDNGAGVIGFEGVNEPADTDVTLVRNIQQQLWTSLQDASLAGLFSVGWSLVTVGTAAANQARINTFIGGTYTNARNTWAFDPGNYVHYGNWHPYPGGFPPDVENSGGPLHLTADNGAHLHSRMFGATWQGTNYAYGRGMIVTETGYNDAVEAPGSNRPVSELADAQYVGRLYAYFFQLGYKRTYKYEFFDEAAMSSAQEQSFGLIRTDGTVKPVYTALQNIITLLADPGAAYTPTAFSYTVTGGDVDLKHFVLGKRDGTFWILMWSAKSVYDRTNLVALTPADQNVTVTFGTAPTSVTRYVPRTGTTGTAVTVTSGSAAVVVPAELIILKVTP